LLLLDQFLRPRHENSQLAILFPGNCVVSYIIIFASLLLASSRRMTHLESVTRSRSTAPAIFIREFVLSSTTRNSSLFVLRCWFVLFSAVWQLLRAAFSLFSDGCVARETENHPLECVRVCTYGLDAPKVRERRSQQQQQQHPREQKKYDPISALTSQSHGDVWKYVPVLQNL
jgi:hypothetical protein